MKFLNVQFILLYILLDVLLFPRRDNPGMFWKLLFSHWMLQGKKAYYIYRPLQFIFAAAGLYFTFITAGWLVSIAYLLAFVLYVTDLWYYILNLELETLLQYESVGERTYWLEHFYQLGHYTWRHFSLWQFMVYSIAGTIFLIISNLI